jgi:hypothetical protein
MAAQYRLSFWRRVLNRVVRVLLQVGLAPRYMYLLTVWGRKSGRLYSTPVMLEELLDVDREYREKAAAGRLRRITPRRFNPSGEAWLPVLHNQRAERHYMALFSNTARAHQMDMTRDWVVLYYDGGRGERQCTVITSQRGALKGKRIVRGREAECMQYYQQQKVPVT